MKRIFVILLLLIIIISLCGCKTEDYTEIHTSEDYSLIDYYTAHGDLYQTILFNKQTGITIITTYYWVSTDRGSEELDRIEVIRVDKEGKLVS